MTEEHRATRPEWERELLDSGVLMVILSPDYFAQPEPHEQTRFAMAHGMPIIFWVPDDGRSTDLPEDVMRYPRLWLVHDAAGAHAALRDMGIEPVAVTDYEWTTGTLERRERRDYPE